MYAIRSYYDLRAKRLRKIVEKEEILIRFEYEPEEIEEITAAQKHIVFKKSIRLSVLFSICFAIIFMPFVLFSMEHGSTLPPMLPIARITSYNVCYTKLLRLSAGVA